MADELYRPGFSFENPRVTRIPAPQRVRPWFYQDTAVGPLTVVSKDVPFERDRLFHPYLPVWLREAKQANRNRVGIISRGVPSFSELGDASPSTAPTTGLSRDANSGFLNNALLAATGFLDTASSMASTITGNLTTMEQQKAQMAYAQQQALAQSGRGSGTSWVWIVGLGAVGALTIMWLRR